MADFGVYWRVAGPFRAVDEVRRSRVGIDGKGLCASLFRLAATAALDFREVNPRESTHR